jgi:hypothetical protein
VIRRLARVLSLALWAVAATATPVGADDPGPAAPSRLRGTSLDDNHLLDELVARSATGRHLVAELGRSDLVVFVRHEWFQTQILRGRIGVVASREHVRLFAIEINSHQTRTEQLAALGHELQHALEIANAPFVHDARSLAALYTSIGEPSGYPGAERYETAAAVAAGYRVRQELVAPAMPGSNALRN